MIKFEYNQREFLLIIRALDIQRHTLFESRKLLIEHGDNDACVPINDMMRENRLLIDKVKREMRK